MAENRLASQEGLCSMELVSEKDIHCLSIFHARFDLCADLNTGLWSATDSPTFSWKHEIETDRLLRNVSKFLAVNMARHPTGQYMVRQFNSRNGPVKAKFPYLCTNGCCRLRNTVLVKLCTSRDDCAIARNSLENRFPEYLAVTFTRCFGCHKRQQIFVPSGHFLILERAKNRRELCEMNKVDGPFLYWSS